MVSVTQASLFLIGCAAAVQVNPLLELFGNASTVLNENSSRFGKLVELEYDDQGTLTTGKSPVCVCASTTHSLTRHHHRHRHRHRHPLQKKHNLLQD